MASGQIKPNWVLASRDPCHTNPSGLNFGSLVLLSGFLTAKIFRIGRKSGGSCSRYSMITVKMRRLICFFTSATFDRMAARGRLRLAHIEDPVLN